MQERGYGSSDKSPPSYVTLSHRWGTQSFRLTTRETLEEHRKGIAFNILSPVFKEAVIITRQLGFRYLWIDSLCILQQDDEDWDRESMQMGQIYMCAVLNLADATPGGGWGSKQGREDLNIAYDGSLHSG